MERKNKRTKSVGNGEGSLYYSETLKIWIYQYTYNGERKSIKQHKGEQVKEFKKRVIDLKNKLNLGIYIATDKTTVASLGRKIIDAKFKRNIISPVTYNRTLQTFSHIENSHISNIQVQKITSEELQNFIDSKQHYSNSFIDKIIYLLNCIFEEAVKKDMILKSPMVYVEKPKSIKKDKKVRAFTTDEQKLFTEYLRSTPETYKNIFILLIYTGMRVGEVLALKRNDIDLTNKVIHVKRTLTKDINGYVVLGDSTKTENSIRDIPITPLFEKDLRCVLGDMILNPDNLLFVQPNGKLISPNMINTVFKRICTNLNIDTKPWFKKKGKKYINMKTSTCNTHMLRHTFATRCIESGMPAAVLQKLLGHSDIKTTINTYTNVFDKFKNKEVDKYVSYIKSMQ